MSDITSLGAEALALTAAYRQAIRRIQAAEALCAVNPTHANALAALAKIKVEAEAIMSIETYHHITDGPELREVIFAERLTPGKQEYLHALFEEAP